MTLEEHDEEIEAARVGRKMLAAEQFESIVQGGRPYTVKAGSRLTIYGQACDGSELMAGLWSAGGVYTVRIPRVYWQHLDLEPKRRPPHEPA